MLTGPLCWGNVIAGYEGIIFKRVWQIYLLPSSETGALTYLIAVRCSGAVLQTVCGEYCSARPPGLAPLAQSRKCFTTFKNWDGTRRCEQRLSMSGLKSTFPDRRLLGVSGPTSTALRLFVQSGVGRIADLCLLGKEPSRISRYYIRESLAWPGLVCRCPPLTPVIVKPYNNCSNSPRGIDNSCAIGIG